MTHTSILDPETRVRERLARLEEHYSTMSDDGLMAAAVVIDRIMERRRLEKLAGLTPRDRDGARAPHSREEQRA